MHLIASLHAMHSCSLRFLFSIRFPHLHHLDMYKHNQDIMSSVLCKKSQGARLWMRLAPCSSNSLFDIHICWKVPSEASIEAPAMHYASMRKICRARIKMQLCTGPTSIGHFVSWPFLFLEAERAVQMRRPQRSKHCITCDAAETLLMGTLDGKYARVNTHLSRHCSAALWCSPAA